MAWREHLEFSDAFWTYIGWEDKSIDQGLQRTFDELRDTEEGKNLSPSWITSMHWTMTRHSWPRVIPTTMMRTPCWHPKMQTMPTAGSCTTQNTAHHYEQCLLVHDECQIATKIMHEGAQADPEQRAAA